MLWAPSPGRIRLPTKSRLPLLFALILFVSFILILKGVGEAIILYYSNLPLGQLATYQVATHHVALGG